MLNKVYLNICAIYSRFFIYVFYNFFYNTNRFFFYCYFFLFSFKQIHYEFSRNPLKKITYQKKNGNLS